MSKFDKKTADAIRVMVDNGEATKDEATAFLVERVKGGYESGKNPKYKSVKLLADLTGSTYESTRAKYDKSYEAKDKSTKRKATKPSANHAQLDGLTVAFVEADVLKLMDSRTTKAAITRMNKGMIKDPLKVANLREAERRLGLVEPEQAKPVSADARIDALEAKLDKLLAVFG